MKTVLDRKLRVLFILSADNQFSEQHPLWEVIQSFRTSLLQIHLVVFIKEKAPTHQQFIQVDDQLSIYYVRQHFLLWKAQYVWQQLQFNLRWQNVFQPDIVVSFTDGIAAWIGYLLAWRNKKNFFMQGSAHLLADSKTSLRFMLNRFLLQHARGIFVSGKETAAFFAETFSILPEQFFPIQPSFDLETLIHKNEKYDFHADHPQYNFFITSVVYFKKDVRTLIAIHKIIAAKYPRVALFIMADKSLLGKVNRIIKSANAFGVFAYEQNDSLLSYINASHLYLAVSNSQDVDTSMITALGLRTPVVTTAYGIAPELFKTTPYEEYMVADDNIETIAHVVIKLVENQQLRTEYGLNTGILLSRGAFTTNAQYAQLITKTIEEIVNPELQPVKLIKDLPVTKVEETLP